ncbi:TonB-dependent receptor [Rhodothermus marinus]|uniref:TonB-dependent receptor n=1 Tax=Rhodothermus marinus TaxID=29549 RepID=UPI0012BA5291|nr:TonB-dependent receptor [Rhodothermus marinus]BBM69606.1 TonB-dependent receptor [Rhodothermus marinus]BBM72588.1 TonB-dependent receptor [Rhodothermus marinus]
MMATRYGLLPGLLLMLVVPVWAQTGKLAGYVRDAETGQPLIGATVYIEETGQGAVTDAQGYYVVLNLRPGLYTVRFSYVGYETVRYTDVRIVSDQTRELEVRLRPSVVAGEEVVITAQRPLVQRDLTSSRKTVVAEEIQALPVESFLDVLALQAGVNRGPSGELHIRGGRSTEIAYLVDGLSVGNPFNANGLATEVATNAIQELTVVSGTFNAEYGQAMSGIVNVVTKEGGEKLEGTFSAYAGDYLTRHEDIFYLPPGIQRNTTTIEGTLGGPVPLTGKKVRFFFSARRDQSDGHLWGIREHLPSDSANFNVNPWYYEIQGRPWTAYVDSLPVPDERVPMNPRTSSNLLLKLTARPFQTLKVEYTHMRDRARTRPFAFEYRFNPDGVVTYRDWSRNHALHLTHTLSSRTFYTIRLSYATHSFRSYLYENPTDPRYVSDGRIVGFPGNQFLFGGDQKGHVYEDSRSWRAKLDITHQFGRIHQAKAGIDWNVHYLSRENFVVLYDGNQYREPTVPPLDSPAHDRYRNRRVLIWSAYVQDKMEFEQFIVNAGVRFDYFWPEGEYIPDLLDPLGPRRRSRPRYRFSPRLGISFPITETGFIHLSYGHFYQMPPLRNIYINPEFEFGVGTTPTFGNANLRPERTVMYEIGLQQQLGALVAIDVTAYYKDIRDYLTLQTVQFRTASDPLYRIYLNKDYANVKGLTFSLTKRRGRDDRLAATLDYTFQIAEGNRDDANAFYFNFLSGRETPLELVPLDFDQRHVVSSTVTYGTGSWGVSLKGQFATGYPYTPELINQKVDLKPNSARKPSQMTVDLYLYRTFTLGPASLQLFARVYNLSDRLNERFVFNDTGRATYSLARYRNLHATWEPYYGKPGIHTLDEYLTRPHWFGPPREVRVGMSLSF